MRFFGQKTAPGNMELFPPVPVYSLRKTNRINGNGGKI